MEHVGIDVHKNQSQICLLTEAGEVLHQRIHTQRERFVAVFAERPQARILIEASTESAWVAQCLDALGHEVIVADPNYAPMYAQRSRRVKTDRRVMPRPWPMPVGWAHTTRRIGRRSANGMCERCSPCARPGCGAVHGGSVWCERC
jgi:hypothetical protein